MSKTVGHYSETCLTIRQTGEISEYAYLLFWEKMVRKLSSGHSCVRVRGIVMQHEHEQVSSLEHAVSILNMPHKECVIIYNSTASGSTWRFDERHAQNCTKKRCFSSLENVVCTAILCRAKNEGGSARILHEYTYLEILTVYLLFTQPRWSNFFFFLHRLGPKRPYNCTSWSLRLETNESIEHKWGV